MDPGRRLPVLGGGPASRPVGRRGPRARHPARLAAGLGADRDVDLVVEPGERVLVTGASGAGKSTLLAAVAGLLDDEGAEWAGELVRRRPRRRRRHAIGWGCSPRIPTASWS